MPGGEPSRAGRAASTSPDSAPDAKRGVGASTSAPRRRSRASRSTSAATTARAARARAERERPPPDVDLTAFDEPTRPAVVDGRTARAERTRAVIVDAVLSLLEEGEVLPTAHRIADRAGISLRLIYHHFGDLESLFQAVSMRQLERMDDVLRPIELDTDLDGRVHALVHKRLEIHRRLAPLRRAALLQEPFSPHLTATRLAGLANGRDEIESVFADELSRVGADERAIVVSALAGALSWGAWNDLQLSGRSDDEIADAFLLLARATVRELHADRT